MRLSRKQGKLWLFFCRKETRVRENGSLNCKKKKLDSGAIRCESLGSDALSTRHYKYWGRRLAELKEAYDGHQPRIPLQVWRDDRHVVQWWTFWIAALVLFLTSLFGLIQSITGILQITSV
jgi:hypothetical protein